MILDTGVLYAGFDRRDDWHASSADLLTIARGPLRVPSLVVTEVCYLLGSRLGAPAEADFLTALGRHDFDVVSLSGPDYVRAAELVRRYSDLPLGAVDASVIAVAERLGDEDVATTDRRHFHAVPEARSFTLYPARAAAVGLGSGHVYRFGRCRGPAAAAAVAGRHTT